MSLGVAFAQPVRLIRETVDEADGWRNRLEQNPTDGEAEYALADLMEVLLDRIRWLIDIVEPKQQADDDTGTSWLSSDEAERKVGDYPKQHATEDHKVTLREIDEHGGVKRGQANNTSAWQAYQERWVKEHPPKPKEEQLTDEIAAKLAIEELVAERQAEERKENAQYRQWQFSQTPPMTTRPAFVHGQVFAVHGQETSVSPWKYRGLGIFFVDK